MAVVVRGPCPELRPPACPVPCRGEISNSRSSEKPRQKSPHAVAPRSQKLGHNNLEWLENRLRGAAALSSSSTAAATGCNNVKRFEKCLGLLCHAAAFRSPKLGTSTGVTRFSECSEFHKFSTSTEVTRFSKCGKFHKFSTSTGLSSFSECGDFYNFSTSTGVTRFSKSSEFHKFSTSTGVTRFSKCGEFRKCSKSTGLTTFSKCGESHKCSGNSPRGLGPCSPLGTIWTIVPPPLKTRTLGSPRRTPLVLASSSSPPPPSSDNPSSDDASTSNSEALRQQGVSPATYESLLQPTGLGAVPGSFLSPGAAMQANRRLLLSVVGASVLAVGANFLGVTSWLLSGNPEAARGLKLDLLYPVSGYRRCLEPDLGFEFVHLASWLRDQRLAYRAAERGERDRALYPQPQPGRSSPSSSSGGGTGAAAAPVEPLVAYGPSGGSGELNVSVIVASVDSDFRLDRFGDAQAVGSRLLANVIAPRSSGLEATLLAAAQRVVDGVLYYEIEFKVEGPSFRRHNLSVCCVHNSRLFSLNAQSPEAEWREVEKDYRVAAESFRVLQP